MNLFRRCAPVAAVLIVGSMEAGCAAPAAPPETAALLAENAAARRAFAASGELSEQEGRRLVGLLLAEPEPPPVITVTDHIGHQYALEEYEAEGEAFCGREVGGRRRGAAAVGGAMYRWYDLDPRQQARRCLPYWRIKRIEAGRLRGFLGVARD